MADSNQDVIEFEVALRFAFLGLAIFLIIIVLIKLRNKRKELQARKMAMAIGQELDPETMRPISQTRAQPSSADETRSSPWDSGRCLPPYSSVNPPAGTPSATVVAEEAEVTVVATTITVEQEQQRQDRPPAYAK
jgi:hypothetical protein